jgi:hypothetical protein
MKPFFPVIELVDRFTISKLKNEKFHTITDEYNFYLEQLSSYDLSIVQSEIDNLYEIHKNIWNLESELKSGKEHLLDLTEIGRRAIEIRNWNNKRVSLKNIIADKLGQSNIKEIKIDHISQDE